MARSTFARSLKAVSPLFTVYTQRYVVLPRYCPRRRALDAVLCTGWLCAWSRIWGHAAGRVVGRWIRGYEPQPRQLYPNYDNWVCLHGHMGLWPFAR